MRILINSINFSPELTSTGKYTGELAYWLAERGHHVRAVTSPPHYPSWKVFGGYSPWRYTKERWRPPVGSGILEILRCPTWVPRMPRGWRRLLYLGSFSISNWPVMLAQTFWKPDLVILIEPTLSSCPQVLTTAFLSGAAPWLHVQDFEADVAFQLTDFSSARFRRFVHLIERALMRRFAGVSTISRRMIERLSIKGVPANRTTLFPNWVDTSEIYPISGPNSWRAELGISPDILVALYSGNMGLKQGLHFLIEVSRKLAARRDIYFVLCGEGPYKEELMAMAGASPCNLRFLPLQPVERLNELLNLADFHLLPQLGGAADLVMPSKLTGMLASGKPVVATSEPGSQIATVLQDCGLVVPHGNADAFAAALVSLAEHPALRTKMGHAARKYAVRHFDRGRILLEFERILECHLHVHSKVVDKR